MRYQKHLIISGFLAIGLAIFWAGSVLGQGISDQSTVNVNHVGSLSFQSIPSTFNFGTTGATSQRRPAYTNPIYDIFNANPLYVNDTRSAGGFTVTLSANADFTDGGTNTILVRNTSPNDNLRIVTATEGTTGGTIAGGVDYPGTTQGPQTVSAPLNVPIGIGSQFGEENTFLDVPNNILDTSTPIVVLDGTLPTTQGRTGIMGVNVAAMLYIPAFQASGQYTTTLTWTLSDSTT